MKKIYQFLCGNCKSKLFKLNERKNGSIRTMKFKVDCPECGSERKIWLETIDVVLKE